MIYSYLLPRSYSRSHNEQLGELALKTSDDHKPLFFFNRPLPHTRAGHNTTLPGNPVYARDMLLFPAESDNCKIGKPLTIALTCRVEGLRTLNVAHSVVSPGFSLKAGLHVRRKHKHKHRDKHKPRVNRDDASTRERNALLFLCLRRPGSHVAYSVLMLVLVLMLTLMLVLASYV